jgi:flagellar motor component MotA
MTTPQSKILKLFDQLAVACVGALAGTLGGYFIFQPSVYTPNVQVFGFHFG